MKLVQFHTGDVWADHGSKWYKVSIGWYHWVLPIFFQKHANPKRHSHLNMNTKYLFWGAPSAASQFKASSYSVLTKCRQSVKCPQALEPRGARAPVGNAIFFCALLRINSWNILIMGVWIPYVQLCNPKMCLQLLGHGLTHYEMTKMPLQNASRCFKLCVEQSVLGHHKMQVWCLILKHSHYKMHFTTPFVLWSHNKMQSHIL